MATCGYLCPSCEGRTFMEDGSVCKWCQPLAKPVVKTDTITDEEWLQSVHTGPCCSDTGEDTMCDDMDIIISPENG
ncbi:MAG: hypothetical protein H7259_02485 [Cytophagales bacterium]|nr:hypothetical protein [Cytophaga sp.]